ncbi:MAG TPA: L,D-transpeptidase family protein [Bacteroidota bacterium]|nr:L,D-transpeptidase family protein [Bacteroidota bacterium]
MFTLTFHMRTQAFWFIALAITVAGCAKSHQTPDPASDQIRSTLDFSGHSSSPRLGSDSVYSPSLVRTFYASRDWKAGWSSAHEVLASADSLIGILRTADREGFRPSDYHLVAIDSTLSRIRQKTGLDPVRRAELDILLTDAFLLYAAHCNEGCIDKDSLVRRWTAASTKFPYDSLLARALETHAISSAIRQLLPHHHYYSDLRGLLASYRSPGKRAGWGSVPFGTPMKGGDVGSRVFALKSRMRASGDLISRSGASGDEYDSTLVDAVRAFQKRHGLDPTGIADSATIAVANVSMERRIEQVKVNLERWRWMPHDLGKRFVLINIPDFQLTVFEGQKPVLTMKVVLGLATWQTPVFSSELTQVLLNAHWFAPDDIVEKELINYMKADTNYLKSNNMSLWREVHDSLVQVDPHTVDWASMNDKTIDFHLRQDPGPQNIMGQIKFLIPNRFNIYLHDTPYRDDFTKTVRMFSHGCIRLEKPAELAEYVLSEFPDWTRERIDTLIARTTEQTLLMKRPIPVHVVYMSAWKDEDGATQYRSDFYGLDARLRLALAKEP